MHNGWKYEGLVHLPTGELRGGGSMERRVSAGVLGGWEMLRHGALKPSPGGDVVTRWSGGGSSFALLGPENNPKEPNFITKNTAHPTNQCYLTLKMSVSGLLCSSVELHLINCALHSSLDSSLLNQTALISLGFYLRTLFIICGGWEFIELLINPTTEPSPAIHPTLCLINNHSPAR